MNWLKRHWFDILLAIVIIIGTIYGFSSGGPAVENVPDVYVIRLDGEVEYALYDFISAGIEEAERRKAEAVLIEIATFGGRVDAMTDIGEAITTAKVPVYTFVRGKALSAGAYIALSGKKIVMTPEAVMGASEPRDQSNQPVTDEKVLSAMRGLFRAAASARIRFSGVKVCMTARPGFSARPQRPTTCVISEKVSSKLRKSSL